MPQLLVLVAVILLSTLGCTAAVETSGRVIDLEAERAFLLETDRIQAEAYSTSETPLDTILASFTDDARVLAPDIPMAEGREASRAVFAKLRALPGYSLKYSPAIADVGGAADLGYTIGTYHMKLPGSDGRLAEINGKYLTIWKRQPDGKWKVAVDMFNADGPPVPATE
jgi:ketosteroid isomerase-like protein